ncbi:hypothetical protein NNO65_01875 [Enterococcus faecium]|nr:hypothetical protein [Enterococcus faecium]
MPEFVNTPNFYQDSDILSKINLPKRRISFTSSANFTGDTKKFKKSISNLEDSEEKRKKRDQKTYQKEKIMIFKKRVSSRHSFFLIESVHKITHFWTLSFFALFFKKTIHFMFINP